MNTKCEIPVLLSDWMLENYGEAVLNEFTILYQAIPLYSIKRECDPRAWVARAFYWDDAEEEPWTNITYDEWSNLSLRWIQYLDAL